MRGGRVRRAGVRSTYELPSVRLLLLLTEGRAPNLRAAAAAERLKSSTNRSLGPNPTSQMTEEQLYSGISHQ